MDNLEKFKNLLFSTEDNFVDKWIKEKVLFENDTVVDMIINNANEKIQEEIDSLTNVFVISLTTIVDIAAIGAVAFMLFKLIKYMWLQNSEDSHKALFYYFCLMMLRILSTVLRVQFGV